jgi:hypothetical protein
MSWKKSDLDCSNEFWRFQMSTDQRIKDLFEMLVRGTRGNLLKWQVTADEDSFRITTPTANVRITSAEVYDQETMQSCVSRKLSVLNGTGRIVEEWRPWTAAEVQEFDSLFVDARRSAYRTDDVLEKLMFDLRSTGVV